MVRIDPMWLQNFANLDEYWFCFILMNICFIIGYFNAFRKTGYNLLIILILLFCVFGFWDPDFFGLAHSFFGISEDKEDFKEPVYEYIRLLSFDSYIVFRLYIWGGALFLLMKSALYYRLPTNLFVYIFLIFYLLTFSYPRASLAISMHFYGFTNILFANKKTMRRYFLGILFIFVSFFFHRSMLVTIALTPMAFFRFNRFGLLVSVILLPLMEIFVLPLIFSIVSDVTFSGEMFNQFNESSNSYMNVMGEAEESNWRFTLIKYLRYSSFYILIVYTVLKSYICKKNIFTKQEEKVLSFAIVLCLFGTIFISSNLTGLRIIGYRYLYMTGIPLCVLMTKMVQRKYCSWKMLHILLIPAFLYSEGFIFGKILSLS
jgi:hypothetical protein